MNGDQLCETGWPNSTKRPGPGLAFSGEARGTPSGRIEAFTAAWSIGPDYYEVTDPGRTKALFKRVD